MSFHYSGRRMKRSHAQKFCTDAFIIYSFKTLSEAVASFNSHDAVAAYLEATGILVPSKPEVLLAIPNRTERLMTEVAQYIF